MQPPLFDGVSEMVDVRRRSTSVDNLFIEDVGLDLLQPIGQLKRRATRYEMLCPLHKEKTPSFFLIIPRNHYECFGCGQRGGPLRLIEQFSLNPEEYLRQKGLYDPARDSALLANAVAEEYNHFQIILRPETFQQFGIEPSR